MAKFKLPDDDTELFEIMNQVDNKDEPKPEQSNTTKAAPPEQGVPKASSDIVDSQSAPSNSVIDDEDSQKQKRREYNSKRNYITSIVSPLERKYIELMRQKQGVSYSEYVQALIKKDMDEHPNEVKFAKMMLEQFESFLS